MTTKRLTVDATPPAVFARHYERGQRANRRSLPDGALEIAFGANKRKMGVMSTQNWGDAPQIHPSQIRVGDVIGTRRPTELRLTVKMISGPQSGPRQWTFFSRDDNGQQRTSTFGEDDLVRRYAKAA